MTDDPHSGLNFPSFNLLASRCFAVAPFGLGLLATEETTCCKDCFFAVFVGWFMSSKSWSMFCSAICCWIDFTDFWFFISDFRLGDVTPSLLFLLRGVPTVASSESESISDGYTAIGNGPQPRSSRNHILYRTEFVVLMTDLSQFGNVSDFRWGISVGGGVGAVTWSRDPFIRFLHTSMTRSSEHIC